MEINPVKQSGRLNPFAFPSNTGFQFALLILTLVGAIIFIYNELYLSLGSNRDNRYLIHEQCLNTESLSSLDDFEKVYIIQTNYIHCVIEPERARALWILTGISLIFISAFLIYLWAPKWKILYSHLEPLGPDNLSDVETYILSLCHTIELRHIPTLFWEPTNGSISGVVFGRLGQYHISLPAGLVNQFYLSDTLPRFRAIVLHELAHLQNADIDKTYFTLAIWWSFAINAVITIPIILLNEGTGIILGWVLRAVALILMVFLVRNTVLHSREFYADVRVSMRDAEIEALSSIIETYPKHENVIQTLLSAHPDPGERLNVLAEPHRLLLNFGGWDFCGIGIIISSVFFNSYFPVLIPTMEMLSNVLSPTAFALLSSNLIPFGLTLIFASIAVGIMGISIWRAMFIRLIQNKKNIGIGKLGFGLGFGLFFGKQLSFFFYEQKITPGILSGASLFTLEMIWGILVIISMFLFVHWIVAGSSVWLEAVITNNSSRRIYLTGQLMIALLLTVLLSQLFNINILLSQGNLFTTATQMIDLSIPENLHNLFYIMLVLASIIINPLTIFGFIILWIFPLSAPVWQKRNDLISRPDWAYLGSPPAIETIPRQNALQPVLALKIGLVGGSIVFGILMFFLIIWHFIPLAKPLFTIFMVGVVFLSVVLQISVAGVSGFRVTSIRWAHSLFSAFIVCLITSISIIVVFFFNEVEITSQTCWLVFILIYYTAAPLVVPTAVGTSILMQRSLKNTKA